jgi:hypothetical protein
MSSDVSKKAREKKSPTEELLAYLEKRIKELEEEENKFRKYALSENKN